MNQKERVFWSDLMARIEPDASTYAAAEARLRAEEDAPLDEAWVRARVADIVAAETQTRQRRRRRLGAVAVLLVFALPALALGTRALLWQSTGSATDTLTYPEATGIMWDGTEPRRCFALGIIFARITTAVDAFRAAQQDADATIAKRGASHMATLLNAIDHHAEQSDVPMDDDWKAIAAIACDTRVDSARRLQELDRLSVLAIGALHVMQETPHDKPHTPVEDAREGLFDFLRKRVTGEEIRDGR